MALILVIDDDAAMRTLATDMVGFAGHETMAFDDGQKAHDYLQKPDRRLPDLILSDVMMPNLDGEHLCAMLRADPDTKRIPVLLMSGKPQLRQAAETIGGSVVGFLAKPFTISALKEALAKALLQRPK